MATDLHLIAKIKTNKEEILQKKDFLVNKLDDLNFDTITVIGIGKLKGSWSYEFPLIYDDELDDLVPDESGEIIYFTGPFVFSMRVYNDCIEFISIYRYSFLYTSDKYPTGYLFQFRNEILQILEVFGAEKEIIYLADNGCDKLSEFLECQIWEGVSYDKVKQNMIATGVPFTRNYHELDYDSLEYSNIKEYIYDDFEDILSAK